MPRVITDLDIEPFRRLAEQAADEKRTLRAQAAYLLERQLLIQPAELQTAPVPTVEPAS